MRGISFYTAHPFPCRTNPLGKLSLDWRLVVGQIQKKRSSHASRVFYKFFFRRGKNKRDDTFFSSTRKRVLHVVGVALIMHPHPGDLHFTSNVFPAGLLRVFPLYAPCLCCKYHQHLKYNSPCVDLISKRHTRNTAVTLKNK